MSKSLSPAEIRFAIEAEIADRHALRDCNEMLFEMSSLVATADSLNESTVSGMIYLLHEKIGERINAIESLTKQLGRAQ